MASRAGQIGAGVGAVGRTVLGTGLLLVGMAGLVLPGPGIPLVVAGLAVLSRDHAWAERALGRIRGAGRAIAARGRGLTGASIPDDAVGART